MHYDFSDISIKRWKIARKCDAWYLSCNPSININILKAKSHATALSFTNSIGENSQERKFILEFYLWKGKIVYTINDKITFAFDIIINLFE